MRVFLPGKLHDKPLDMMYSQRKTGWTG